MPKVSAKPVVPPTSESIPGHISPALTEQWSARGPDTNDVTRLRDQVYYLERATDSLVGQNVEVSDRLQELDASLMAVRDSLDSVKESLDDLLKAFKGGIELIEDRVWQEKS